MFSHAVTEYYAVVSAIADTSVVMHLQKQVELVSYLVRGRELSKNHQRRYDHDHCLILSPRLILTVQIKNLTTHFSVGSHIKRTESSLWNRKTLRTFWLNAWSFHTILHFCPDEAFSWNVGKVFQFQSWYQRTLFPFSTHCYWHAKS